MKKILGIDADSKKIALVCLRENGDRDSHMSLISDKKADNVQRLVDLISLFEKWVEIIKPDKVYIEESIFIQNYLTSRSISEVIGNIKLVLAKAKIDFKMVPVTTWKKNAVGKGNASKEEVKQFIVKKYPDFGEESQDICDATAIALFGVKEESKDKLMDNTNG